MLGYFVTSGICLALLVLIPIWSARADQPQYPFVVILLLAVIVVAVPAIFSRRRRDGGAD